MHEAPKRTYLGDGLFASYDGYQITLAASNGIEDTNVVYLEPGAVASFEAYLKELRETFGRRI